MSSAMQGVLDPAFVSSDQSAVFASSTQPPPSLPPSPSASRSVRTHSMSMDGGSPALFHSDHMFAQDQMQAATMYSTPPSGVQSPVPLSTFPTPSGTYVDHHQMLNRTRASSFASPTRSGFETPITPAESIHSRSAMIPQVLATDGLSVPGVTTSDLIILSLLEAIELSARAAREAMSRGDRHEMLSRTANIGSSADILRGINLSGPTYQPFHPQQQHAQDPSSSSSYMTTDSLNLDAMNLAPHSTFVLPPDLSSPPPLDQRFTSMVTDPAGLPAAQQTPQSFAHGLALLDASDPSRKRTISTATARAIETNRATKTQKLSSTSQGDERPGVPLFSGSTGGDAAVAPQPQPSALRNSWIDPSQEAHFFEDEFASFEHGTNAAGETPSIAGGNVPHAVPPTSSLPRSRTSLSHIGGHGGQSTATSPSRPRARSGVRQSRSSSYSSLSAHPSLSSFGLDVEHPLRAEAESSQSSVVPSRPHTPESFFTGTESDADFEWDGGQMSRRNSHSATQAHHQQGFGDHDERMDASPSRRPSVGRTAMSSEAAATLSNLVPPDLKAEMDRVFDLYLQHVCSDLEAADSKGELIHQTLMPKKMAKMAESSDFRPFKFRIQAFTNAFMECLAQHHLGEDVVAQKKVKAYLWHQQPLISRFNDDGKKSKSKGNHVWHIMAKQLRPNDGSPAASDALPYWIFRPFERKIAGSHPPLAYVGLNWQWQPRVWDPQVAAQSIQTVWSSPHLPAWLCWRNGVLVGCPTASDVTPGIEVLVEASFPMEQRESVKTVIRIQVSPSTVTQQMQSGSLSVDTSERGRGMNHPVENSGYSLADESTPMTAHPLKHASLDHDQVLRVVTESARAVAAAQSVEDQKPLSDASQRQRLSLARQQHVLITTAEALSSLSMETTTHLALPSVSLIATLASDVVNDLAIQHHASRLQQQPQSGPVVPSNAASIRDATSSSDVAASFRSVIAQAVGQDETSSTELEVMMAAKNIVKQGGDILGISTTSSSS